MMNMILMVVKRKEVKNVKQKVILKKKRNGRKEKEVEIVLRYILLNEFLKQIFMFFLCQ